MTHRLATAAFSGAIFVGSFLLFVLEPMVAKMLLPRLGGSPMVWNTCVVFFQALLLGGYFLAHVMQRARWPTGVVVFLGLAAMAGATLPVSFPRQPPVPGSPVVWLFAELGRSLGLVFLVLSAAAPTLQMWFARSAADRARDPYFLYAASNAGSFIALLAYPTLVEPRLLLIDQRRLWTAGYVAFVAILVCCAWMAKPGGRSAFERSVMGIDLPPLKLPATTRLAWFALAFIPSSLMLGVTTYLSTDVAAVPLIWIAPLALYLLTFILAFGGRSAYLTLSSTQRVPVLVTAVVFLISASVLLPITLNIVLHLAAFFAVSLACHGMLAARRPPARQLTTFYLHVSAGGVAGGLFNVLLAPLLFDTALEYPLILIVAVALRMFVRETRSSEPDAIREDLRAATLHAIAIGIALFAVLYFGLPGRLSAVVVGLGAVYGFSQSKRPLRFTLVVASLFVASLLLPTKYGRVVHAERTFFGTYHISISDNERYRSLYHGTTLHGMQSLDPAAAGEPLTYYHRQGPFGQAFDALPAARGAAKIAVIGLGVGSLAAYAQPNQHFSFFEIDPAVERIARDTNHFSFLARCGVACTVVLGDARLSLSRLETRYGLIVLDAFSSDAIPVHLLTSEALAEYLAHLENGGILMFHVSNRYLDLRPLLAGLSATHHLTALEQLQALGPAASEKGRAESHWVTMSQDTEALGPLFADQRWTPIDAAAPNAIAWTDEYSNILSVLRPWR